MSCIRINKDWLIQQFKKKLKLLQLEISDLKESQPTYKPIDPSEPQECKSCNSALGNHKIQIFQILPNR